MSLTATPPSTNTTAAIAPARTVRQRRISTLQLALAFALAALFGLAAAALVVSVAKATPVLALARDVPIGQQITEADLRTVYINKDPGLAPLPAAEKNTVVGKYAVTNLHAGGLLTSKSIAAQAIPGPGQQVAGISLKPGRVPPGLKAGDRVRLVATAPPQTQVDRDNPPPPLPEFTATVIAVVQVNQDTVLAVAIDAGDGPNVARLGAEGRLVVTLAGS